LGRDEWELLRDLRLRSLAESPDAFGQHAEDARTQPREEWQAIARASSAGDRRAWFVAERAETGTGRVAVGIVSGRRRPPGTLLIFSMWVDPGYRRTGVGRALIEAAEAWAIGWGARRSVLWVFAANEPAVRFYLRIGYATESSGDDALTGARYGALAMARRLPDR
jgi:GNAT superfamily N-acetyltransferase